MDQSSCIIVLKLEDLRVEILHTPLVYSYLLIKETNIVYD